LDNFCNWIEKRFNLTGVYIGELKNVKKKINLVDEDSEEAHFDA
jgi:small nuclear ribonucleoprotein (snRNP)-like protein